LYLFDLVGRSGCGGGKSPTVDSHDGCPLKRGYRSVTPLTVPDRASSAPEFHRMIGDTRYQNPVKQGGDETNIIAEEPAALVSEAVCSRLIS